jgi:hypothetical protein
VACGRDSLHGLVRRCGPTTPLALCLSQSWMASRSASRRPADSLFALTTQPGTVLCSYDRTPSLGSRELCWQRSPAGWPSRFGRVLGWLLACLHRSACPGTATR